MRSEGGGLLAQLQSKLAVAEADVARLMVEREKLIEISNMLRLGLGSGLGLALALALTLTRRVGPPAREHLERELVRY